VRGRPKKYVVDKSLPVSLKLSGPAGIVLKGIRKKSKAFDFGRYVSLCLLRDFYEVNKEEVVLNELLSIQFEQDVMNEKFNNLKRAKAIQLENLRQKEPVYEKGH